MIQADTCENSDIGSGGDGLILRSVITTHFFRKTLRLLITDSQRMKQLARQATYWQSGCWPCTVKTAVQVTQWSPKKQQRQHSEARSKEKGPGLSNCEKHVFTQAKSEIFCPDLECVTNGIQCFACKLQSCSCWLATQDVLECCWPMVG